MTYATSGLENPLSYLLAVLFHHGLLALTTRALEAVRPVCGGPRDLNRFDLALLFGPALLVEIVRDRSRRGIAMVLAGSSPLILWLCFDDLLWLSPPNPATRSSRRGSAWAYYLAHGVDYYRDALARETLT